MKMKSIFLSMLAIMALASCNNDDDVNNSGLQNGEGRNLKIQFQTSAPKSRAIETPGTPTGEQTVITTATVYFFKMDGSASGFNGGKMELSPDAIANAMGDEGHFIEKVDADVKSITIRANGGEKLEGKNINEFQGAEVADPTNGFHKFFELEGSSTLTDVGQNTDGHKLYAADVELAPALVRLEVTGGFDVKPVYTRGAEQLKNAKGELLYEHKKTDGTYYNSPANYHVEVVDDKTYPIVPAHAKIQTGYYSMEVVAVHMNNIILKKGELTHPWVQVGTTPAWNNAFATGGTHENMFDKLTDDTRETFGAVTAGTAGHWWTEQTAPADRNVRIIDGKAAAYQLFNQSSTATDKISLGEDLPHVIVEVNIVDQKGNTPRKAYVNIRNFFKTDGTTRLQSFENGKIYKFSLNELSDAFADVRFEEGTKVVPGPDTDEPDPDTFFDLNVKVSIVDWTVENIIPEI